MHRFRIQGVTTVAGCFLAALVGCKRAADNPAANAAASRGAGVQVVAVTVRSQPVREVVPLVGSVAANELVELKAETDGVVKGIAFDEGGRVQKGALLVALDETKAGAELAETEANLKLGETTFQRAEQLLRDKLISQQEYETASATFLRSKATVELMRRRLRDSRVFAPFSGITAARQISPGQVISKNTTLTTLVDLDTVKIEVAVPERYLGQLQLGQKLDFKVDAFPTNLFQGNVYFISPQLEDRTRTALVKARLNNPDGKLRGGMFAKLDLTLTLRDSALVIPETAIVNNADATMVFVISSGNTAVMKPVTTGLRLAGKVEILTGLTAGESVIVEGLQKIGPGSPVKSAGTNAAQAYQN